MKNTFLFTKNTSTLALAFILPSAALAQTPATPTVPTVPTVTEKPTLQAPAKAVPVEKAAAATPATPTTATPVEKADPKAVVDTDPTNPDNPAPVVDPTAPEEPKPFIPTGGLAVLTKQADIDLFTVGKDVGNTHDKAANPYRRLVQRTIMQTEPKPEYGYTLTFDDQLTAEEPTWGNATDIAKDLAPLGARSIFFANVPKVSAKTVDSIFAENKTTESRLKATSVILESKRIEFIRAIRTLIRIKCPADADGNQQYACEVYNHTAFHMNMRNFTVDSDKYKISILGIEFIEACIDHAYKAERPGWERARYFRFPFLASPRNREAQTALNAVFTKLGLVSLGETQDSKDYSNESPKFAYDALAAAKAGRRYNPKEKGVFGRADSPIALFHTKTWPNIKSGVIKSIKEK